MGTSKVMESPGESLAPARRLRQRLETAAAWWLKSFSTGPEYSLDS